MEYKYYLSLCVCVKNEANHIEDFIRHYVNQGVEHFYIINNNSSDNIQDVIDNSIHKSLVTLITDNRPMNIFHAYSKTTGIPGMLTSNFYELIKRDSELEMNHTVIASDSKHKWALWAHKTGKQIIVIIQKGVNTIYKRIVNTLSDAWIAAHSLLVSVEISLEVTLN